jgi:hypothetical protein
VDVLSVSAEAFIIRLESQRVLPAAPALKSETVLSREEWEYICMITGTASYISEAKVILGRDECTNDRFSIRSTAIWASLTITIVCPKTVIELIGPGTEMISGQTSKLGHIRLDHTV